MKFNILNLLIIGILTYYLFKGLMFLLMWQALVQIEGKGKEKKAKREQEIKTKRERRDQKARENWNRKS